jgi:hypothetical protein
LGSQYYMLKFFFFFFFWFPFVSSVGVGVRVPFIQVTSFSLSFSQIGHRSRSSMNGERLNECSVTLPHHPA